MRPSRMHLVCVSIRQHTSAYVSVRQHTSAYAIEAVKGGEHAALAHASAFVSIRQHTHTSAYAYVSIRQHTLRAESVRPSHASGSALVSTAIEEHRRAHALKEAHST